MPDLTHSLLKQDIGHLRIIAEFWGLELDSKTVDDAREELAASLLDMELAAELIASLSPQADSAIRALVEEGGRIPWVTFARKYGDIRSLNSAWGTDYPRFDAVSLLADEDARKQGLWPLLHEHMICCEEEDAD